VRVKPTATTTTATTTTSSTTTLDTASTPLSLTPPAGLSRRVRRSGSERPPAPHARCAPCRPVA
jgi:hypothetical protein